MGAENDTTSLGRGDLVERARATTLGAVIIFLMAALVLMLVGALARDFQTTVIFERVPAALLLLTAGVIQLLLLRSGRRELVAWILTATMTALYCVVVFTGSARSLAFTAMLPVPLIFSILIGRRWSTPLIGAILLATISIKLLISDEKLSLPPISIIVNTMIIIGLFLLIADRLARLLESAVESLQADAIRMNALNMELNAALAARDQAEALRLDVERKLQETKRFESLGLMAAGMAHDFNNIIQGILGQSELLLLTTELDDKSKQALEQIRDGAEGLGIRCRKLQEFAGERKVRPSPINPAECLQQSVRLYEAIRPERITLNVDIPATLPQVSLDSEMIQDVVLNLLKNAGEAISDKGRIEISAGIVERSADSLLANRSRIPLVPGHYLSIRVTDTGSGMDVATQSRVCEPFFTTKTNGHGLGLASSLGTIREHKAGFFLTSSPGEGTTFEILFPLSNYQIA